MRTIIIITPTVQIMGEGASKLTRGISSSSSSTCLLVVGTRCGLLGFVAVVVVVRVFVYGVFDRKLVATSSVGY